MKNFGLFLLGIIIGVLAMYFYCQSSETPAAVELQAIAPNGIISSKQASALDAGYNVKHKIINDSLFKNSKNGGDNRSSWWSVEEIQNYINHAEQQTGEMGYTMDGLRVYLGSYPDANGKTGLTTMFIVPTGIKNVSTGSIISFQGGSHDISGADGLNVSQHGKPPGANYPQ
ncbi:hypothetical protein HNV08_07695 [Winogradskyella eckloniae]|uniref:hypothetical protein n=1 Tax=Winogradskyella eckloniae TaxID=1089306 RepID=UPI0015662CBE|nr:hypothetical protein [Winogradskyella eckloniae]NRD19926.1 hypothetical protein [Winogradskyella eckloniae]